ncbi:MAG: cupin domain-containing protein [Sporichthyaceae bacterium]
MPFRIALLIVSIALMGCGSASGVGPAGVTREPLAKGTAQSLDLDPPDGSVEVTHLLVTWDPQGTTAWVKWQGPLLVTVKSGELSYQTPDEVDCAVQTFPAGVSHVIPADTVHQAFTTGSEKAEAHIVAFVPAASGPLLVDEPKRC